MPCCVHWPLAHSAMPLDSSAVPNEIWFEIAMLLDFKALLALEATCKFFREVVLNRLFWLERLRALEQDHAPDLPHHVSISDLTLEQLRTLVVRAHRCLLNYTGPAPMRPTRETTIRVGSEDSDDEHGGKHDLVDDMELLPGGSLLLVLWVSGYLQCWTVPGGECLWTYRPPDSRVVLNSGFAYEMQADGDVRVLVVSEPNGRNTSER
ncbi:hypothetical protein DFH11DRAFT_1521362 [Phellopilus nigrolimitatus]|nr:hypothetical protein DFH11DRAFT_1521362 [Phellopilus nigrolimitatus]